jgi:pyruvate kinase
MIRFLPLLLLLPHLSLILAVCPADARPARPGIIATIGPSSRRGPTLRKMIRSGLGMARINMTHSDARSTRAITRSIRGAARAEGRSIPILCDLPGGKVRTGTSGQPVTLRSGQRFDLVLGSRQATTSERAYVNYKALNQHVKSGDRVLLDDGRLELRVTSTRPGMVKTQVVRGGALRSRTGVAIQGKELPFPSMTRRDRHKLKIAVANGADYVGVSFAQSPRNVLAVRRALHRLGADHVKVVAKIESRSGLANLDAIIDAADAVMIARGDLGLAVGKRGLPAAQRRIAARCRARGKPFITATGLLSNMMTSPRPSRSNLRDIWRSAKQGPTYLMINETAIGPYPVEAVGALSGALRKR